MVRDASACPAVSLLIRRIAKHGWSEESARQFEAQYGRKIRWQIITSMERLGMLRFRVSPERTSVLSNRRSELYENTLSDLWIQLLDGVVERYVQGAREGRIRQDIVPYLRGVIRHLVLSNARDLGLIGAETPQEMVSAFCQAKLDETRNARLAWLKFALGGRVRESVLTRCGADTFQSVYRAVHHVVDYFFEELIPSKCAEIASLGPRILDAMIGDLLDSSHLESAVQYIGSVTPFASGGGAVSRVPDGVDEDEYLSSLDRAADGRYR